MNITVFDYADAVGVHLGTARRRLECVPRDVRSRPHRFGLADALLTLKQKEVDDGWSLQSRSKMIACTSLMM